MGRGLLLSRVQLVDATHPRRRAAPDREQALDNKWRRVDALSLLRTGERRLLLPLTDDLSAGDVRGMGNRKKAQMQCGVTSSRGESSKHTSGGRQWFPLASLLLPSAPSNGKHVKESITDTATAVHRSVPRY